jgi:hypothetical protein
VKARGTCFGAMFKAVLLGTDVDGNAWSRSTRLESQPPYEDILQMERRARRSNFRVNYLCPFCRGSKR